jgi:tRNA A-37 threonylcarbamoyl transferase component Bud32
MTYSVETREATRGGDDYTENHEDFNTPEEVRKYIGKLHEDEHVHSVLLYADGQTSNPRDVTQDFKLGKRKSRVW